MTTFKVEVDTNTFIRFLVIVTGFVGVIFMTWKLWPMLMIIAVSFFLALALNPPVSVLSRKLPGHSRVVATALSYLVVLTILGIFIYIALPPVIDQTNKFIAALPQYVADLSSQKGVIADLINRYNLQSQVQQLVDGAQQQAGNVARGIGDSLIIGVSSILSGFVTLLTVLVLTFLMLIEGPRWLERMWSFYTDPDLLERHQNLAAKMYKVVSGYVNGQVLVASIAASLGLVTLLILNALFNVPVSAVIPLAGILFITSLIPMIGATLGAIIIVTVLMFNDVSAAIVFLIYFIIYQQIENNFIQPLVQSRTVALSALSVLTAVIFGIGLLGIIGGIIAIPVAGCIRVLVIDYMQHRHSKVTKAQQGQLAKLRRSRA